MRGQVSTSQLRLKRPERRRLLLSAAVTSACLAMTARGQYVPINGGPTYDSAAGQVYYFSNSSYIPHFIINDSGTAVEAAIYGEPPAYDNGTRAVRWDASGAVLELGNLGTGTFGITDTTPRAENNAG